ncbi:hypothetical protein VTO73DRAFT_10880 [Trametes versicolor]
MRPSQRRAWIRSARGSQSDADTLQGTYELASPRAWSTEKQFVLRLVYTHIPHASTLVRSTEIDWHAQRFEPRFLLPRHSTAALSALGTTVASASLARADASCGPLILDLRLGLPLGGRNVHAHASASNVQLA